jgi:hypothetical protein
MPEKHSANLLFMESKAEPLVLKTEWKKIVSTKEEEKVREVTPKADINSSKGTEMKREPIQES